MTDRRFRVRRKGKLEGVGKLDRKMQSSTIEKFGGGTKTASSSSPPSTSTIIPIKKKIAFSKTLKFPVSLSSLSLSLSKNRDTNESTNGIGLERERDSLNLNFAVRYGLGFWEYKEGNGGVEGVKRRRLEWVSEFPRFQNGGTTRLLCCWLRLRPSLRWRCRECRFFHSYLLFIIYY